MEIDIENLKYLCETPGAILRAGEERAKELLKQKLFPMAEIVANAIFKIDPNNAVGLEVMGIVSQYHKNYKTAVEWLERAVNVKPNGDNYNNLALSYFYDGYLPEAYSNIEQAINQEPKNQIFYKNKAFFMANDNKVDQAIETLEFALTIQPNADLFTHLGELYLLNINIDKARETFCKGLEYYHNSPCLRFDKSISYLAKGEWEQGFIEYESRIEWWVQSGKIGKAYFDSRYGGFEKRLLKENKLAKKRIFVFCEQGKGDFIQFCRYLPELRNRGAYVILECPQELLRLFKANDLADEYVVMGEDFSQTFHHNCSVMSLPYILDMTDEKDFLGKAYLKVDHQYDLSNFDDYRKVGVCWGGNPEYTNDRIRSCPLKYFKKFNKDNNKIFVLQKDLRKRKYLGVNNEIDLTEECDDFPLVFLSEHFTDFYDTASAISEMDIVISVDTAVLHLAGALGKETYALIPTYCDWRWKQNWDEKTPWYDSISLIRQNTLGDWQSVFDKIQINLNDKYIY